WGGFFCFWALLGFWGGVVFWGWVWLVGCVCVLLPWGFFFGAPYPFVPRKPKCGAVLLACGVVHSLLY
ncbi:hypothetical protein, partial [Pseudomonas poae]|uniref:hypothetical protein n=1 Tax=Pseudomonas poae TaxID=200451 RepID=UPI0034D64E0E